MCATEIVWLRSIGRACRWSRLNRHCEDAGFRRIFFDFEGATRGVTRRLIAAGHRQILYFGSATDHLQATLCQRLAGYRQAMREVGLWSAEAEALFDYAGAEDETLTEALSRCPDATAVVAAHDVVAARALRVLRRTGRRLPEDMAVVSLHETLVAECTDPPLTAVRHPTYESGHLDAGCLSSRSSSRRGRSVRWFCRPR